MHKGPLEHLRGQLDALCGAILRYRNTRRRSTSGSSRTAIGGSLGPGSPDLAQAEVIVAWAGWGVKFACLQAVLYNAKQMPT